MYGLATGILNVPLAGILFPCQAVSPALYSGEHSIKGTHKHTFSVCVRLSSLYCPLVIQGPLELALEWAQVTTSFAGSELVNELSATSQTRFLTTHPADGRRCSTCDHSTDDRTTTLHHWSKLSTILHSPLQTKAKLQSSWGTT